MCGNAICAAIVCTMEEMLICVVCQNSGRVIFRREKIFIYRNFRLSREALIIEITNAIKVMPITPLKPKYSFSFQVSVAILLNRID